MCSDSHSEMPILSTDVVDLTQQLCTIDSVSGKEGEIVDVVAKGLEEQGWHVHRQKVKTLSYRDD